MRITVETGSPPPPPALAAASVLGRLAREVGNLRVLARTGVIRPVRPDRLARLALLAPGLKATLGTAVAAAAIRDPRRAVIIDELGTLSYSELHRRADALAVALRELGVREGDPVALLARNHRGFLDAISAIPRAGADVLLLNTGFSAPQIAEVCVREGAVAVIHDAEFAEVLEAVDGLPHLLTDAGPDMGETMEALIDRFAGERPPPPERSGRVTILTSGTTGTPKGASRGASGSGAPSLDAPAGYLDRIPLRSGMRIGLAAPAFHAWGLNNLAFTIGLGATAITRRKFDPEAWLALVHEHRLDALVVVPVMLSRILDLPEHVRNRYDTGSLSIVAASGSALPGDLATRWMDTFGDNLHNLYGSTEVAAATIATPADLRAAPGTAGRPTRGTTVKLLDADGYAVDQGTTGRIFVGSAMLFEGYTGGADKQRIGGLMSTGDLGWFDETGRLFVAGRDDEMIVSGGENVFPKEIEDSLTSHPAVNEAACIGVDDETFGQRLVAFVVLCDGASADESELKAHVKAETAGYKVPRVVVFIDSLPRNATGKVLKRDLKSRV